MTRSSSATRSPERFIRKKILANSGAQRRRPSDSSPRRIGTGVISTAIKRGKADFAWIRGAVRSMTTLNKAAAEVSLPADSTCTA